MPATPKHSRLLLASGIFSLYASLASFSALWPFMVEAAGVDSASYGGFLGAGSILSLFARGLLMAANNLGVVAYAGAIFSIGSAAILLTGYTYHTILFSTIFQRLGLAASMMGRGLAAGLEVPRSWRGVFTAGVVSSAQLGMLIGVNLGLSTFLLTGSYIYALISGIFLAALSMILLAPWRKVRLFEENFSLKLLIPSSRPAKLLLAICCADAFIWGGVFGFAYVLAPSYLGAVESDIALARSLTMILAIPMNLVFGAISDKLRSRAPFLVLSEVFGAAALFCYAIIRSPISIIVFGLLMGFVASTWAPIVIALFTELSPRGELGAVLSSWSVLAGASRILYPMIGGLIIERLGVGFFFNLSGALLLALAILMAILLKGY